MISKAFPTAGLSAPPVPSAVTGPFATTLSVLQPVQSRATLQCHGSRGSPVCVCGSLWVSIYRKTHKHRSHFLSLLLGFLLSQNRLMTPAYDLVSSLAKTSLDS